MKKFKKALSMLILLCMLITTLPATAFATGSNNESNVTPKNFKVSFELTENARWTNWVPKFISKQYTVNDNSNIKAPKVKAADGLEFTGWNAVEIDHTLQANEKIDTKYLKDNYTWNEKTPHIKYKATFKKIDSQPENPDFEPDTDSMPSIKATFKLQEPGWIGKFYKKTVAKTVKQDTTIQTPIVHKFSHKNSDAIAWESTCGNLHIDAGNAVSFEQLVDALGEKYPGETNIEFISVKAGKPDEEKPLPQPTEKYSVTFNTNGGNEIDTQVVEKGNKAVEPETPVKEGYTFDNWYTDENLTTPYDFNTPVNSDITLYAGWSENKLPDYDDYMLPLDDESGELITEGTSSVDSITDLIISDNVATVTVNCINDSIVNVQILNEDDKTILAEGASNANAGVTSEPIEVILEGEIPQYFIANVRLLNMNMDEITSFEFKQYTHSYKEFQELTVESFPEELVINLDDDPKQNFVVLSEDVLSFTVKNDEFNISEDENGNYIITSANNLPEIQTGDKLRINTGDVEPLFIKVKSATVNDNKLIIVEEKEDVYLEDFFDLVKLNPKLDPNAPLDIDLTNATPGVTIADEPPVNTFSSDVEIDRNCSIKPNFNIKTKLSEHVDIDSGVSIEYKIDLKIEYDVRLSKKDYFYAKFKNESKTKFYGAVEISADNLPDNEKESSLNLGKISLPFGLPGLYGFVEPEIDFKIDAKGKFTVETVNTKESGYLYQTGSETQPFDKESSSFNAGLEGKIKACIGPCLNTGLQITKKGFVKAELSPECGVKIELNTELKGGETSEPEKHACTSCIDGSISVYGKVTAKLKYKINKKISGTPISGTLYEKVYRDEKCYLSLINNESSIFKGKVHLGYGKCPNHTYRTNFVAKDSNDSVVNTTIELTRTDSNKCAGKLNSNDSKYLYPGKYKAKATIDNINIEKTFVVSKNTADATIIISPLVRDSQLSGTITEAENTGKKIKGAMVVVYSGDNYIDKTTSDDNGNYTISLPAGEYDLFINADGYKPFQYMLNIPDNDTVTLQTSLMIENSNCKYGGISGYIKDSINGNPIADAKILFRKGWNNTGLNSSETAVDYTAQTKSDGSFNKEYKKFFGAIMGIEAGNYTLEIQKPGYITGYLNVVVRPEINSQNQNTTLTPEGRNGYSIVLTWGSSPNDLDSHYNCLTKSDSKEHVFYSNKNSNSARLDIDYTSGFGPETITIDDSTVKEFYYSVHDFTNRGNSSNTALSTSGAKVEVSKNGQPIKTFYVPGNVIGDTWHVFKIDSNGDIITLNTFCTSGSANNVGQELF